MICILIISDDPWEIKFEHIKNLNWLDRGSQGVVFVGDYNGEPVAVKKVTSKADTDIRHLRKLNHPNIVAFKVSLYLFCMLFDHFLFVY